MVVIKQNKQSAPYVVVMSRQNKVLPMLWSCHDKTNQRLSRACIVHLVIKKTNWSYVKTMSCVILELRST